MEEIIKETAVRLGIDPSDDGRMEILRDLCEAVHETGFNEGFIEAGGEIEED